MRWKFSYLYAAAGPGAQWANGSMSNALWTVAGSELQSKR
jgi:hypothetical protein